MNESSPDAYMEAHGREKRRAKTRLMCVWKGLPHTKRAKLRALLRHEVRYAPR